MADANFKEHAQSFELTFPDGTVQRVAKGALSPEAQERIRKQYAPTAPATPLGGATVVPVREPGLTLAPAPAPGPEVPAFPGGVERLPLTATPEEKAAAQQAQEEWLAKYEKPLFGPARPREDAAPAQPVGPAPVDPASLQVFGGQGTPGQVQPASYTREGGGALSFQASGPAGGGGVRAPGSGERELGRAYDAQAAAQREATAAAEAKAREVAAFQDESARRQEARLTEAQAKEAERQKQADTQLAEVTKATQALVSDKATEVDPNRLWNSRSTGQKVLAGFASFLAGFAGDAVGPVRRAIQQDIELQKDALNRRREGAKDALAAQQGLYGLMRAKFGDERVAEAAAMDAGLALAEKQLQAVLARTAGAEAKAQGQVALAAIAEERAKGTVALRQQAYENALKSEQLGLQRMSLGLEAAKAAQGAQGAGGELAVPGYGVATTGKEGAKKGREMAASYANMASLIDKMIAGREAKGAEVLDRDHVRAMEATKRQLMLALKDAENLGTLDKGSVEFLEGMLPDATGVGNVLPQLQTLRANLAEGFRKRLYATTGIQTEPSTFRAAR